jgi:hypothetical protein
MSAWEVLLSNGERIKENESDVSSWRKLHRKCVSEDLQVVRIWHDQQDVMAARSIKSPDSVFVFGSMIAVMGGPEITCKGIAFTYLNGEKVRVCWYDQHGKFIHCQIGYREEYSMADEVEIPIIVDRLR